MIIRNFLTDEVHKNFKKELSSYEWDRKYYDTRRKKVLNKLERMFVMVKKGRKADFQNKKGTIIGFDKSPLVENLLRVVEILMKDKDLIV